MNVLRRDVMHHATPRTGNTAHGARLFANWTIVYFANLAEAPGSVMLVGLAGTHELGGVRSAA